MRLTNNQIKDKFEPNGTVQDIRRHISRRPRTSTSFISQEFVLESNPETTVKQVLRLASANQVLEKLHSNNGNAIYEDDRDRRKQFCE
ncbi:hypothetical protein AVEN_151704-1 [Araneus ventricosus]|uniref:Uncharacterized protein n=1 Tax=Araneus ventricosus TaxID=182803 RepID=A0A4Y2DPP9_ARAVE|nr:hypothetical protein AVEN_151704-1 [Araneus ventricosus]